MSCPCAACIPGLIVLANCTEDDDARAEIRDDINRSKMMRDGDPRYAERPLEELL